MYIQSTSANMKKIAHTFAICDIGKPNTKLSREKYTAYITHIAFFVELDDMGFTEEAT